MLLLVGEGSFALLVHGLSSQVRRRCSEGRPKGPIRDLEVQLTAGPTPARHRGNRARVQEALEDGSNHAVCNASCLHDVGGPGQSASCSNSKDHFDGFFVAEDRCGQSARRERIG